jgi:hypothetical protein
MEQFDDSEAKILSDLLREYRKRISLLGANIYYIYIN